MLLLISVNLHLFVNMMWNAQMFTSSHFKMMLSIIIIGGICSHHLYLNTGSEQKILGKLSLMVKKLFPHYMWKFLCSNVYKSPLFWCIGTSPEQKISGKLSLMVKKLFAHYMWNFLCSNVYKSPLFFGVLK